MTQAIIWDWNGTLLNDADISYKILNELLSRHGFKQVESLDAYRRVFGFPVKDYYIRAGFNFEKTSYEQLAEQYTALYAQRVAACTLHEGAEQVLKAVKRAGIAQLILSASKQSVLLKQVKGFGISQYFDELVGTDDIYAAGKIQAGLLWKKRSRIQNALLCGDTLHDLEVANALCAECVLFDKGHHTRQALLSTGARVIGSLTDLLAFL